MYTIWKKGKMTTYPNHEQQILQNNSCTYIVRAVGTGWAQGHVLTSTY